MQSIFSRFLLYLSAPLWLLSALLLPSIASANGAFDAISSSLTTSWTHTVVSGGTSTGIVCYIDTATGSGAPTVTDNATPLTQFDTAQIISSGGSFAQYAFYLLNISTGANNIVVSGGGTFHQAGCESATGLGIVDVTGGTGNSGSPISNSITTTVANDFVIVGLSNNATAFTSPVNYTPQLTNFGGGGFVQNIGDELAVSAGSLTQGDTATAGGVIIGMSQIAFEPAATPPPPTPSGEFTLINPCTGTSTSDVASSTACNLFGTMIVYGAGLFNDGLPLFFGICGLLLALFAILGLTWAISRAISALGGRKHYR